VKLEPRDKKTLIIGGSIAAVIVLYAFVLSPFLSTCPASATDPKRERELVEMKKLRDEYREIQKQLLVAQEAASSAARCSRRSRTLRSART